eukprot:g78427.t1
MILPKRFFFVNLCPKPRSSPLLNSLPDPPQIPRPSPLSAFSSVPDANPAQYSPARQAAEGEPVWLKGIPDVFGIPCRSSPLSLPPLSPFSPRHPLPPALALPPRRSPCGVSCCHLFGLPGRTRQECRRDPALFSRKVRANFFENQSLPATVTGAVSPALSPPRPPAPRPPPAGVVGLPSLVPGCFCFFQLVQVEVLWVLIGRALSVAAKSIQDAAVSSNSDPGIIVSRVLENAFVGQARATQVSTTLLRVLELKQVRASLFRPALDSIEGGTGRAAPQEEKLIQDVSAAPVRAITSSSGSFCLHGRLRGLSVCVGAGWDMPSALRSLLRRVVGAAQTKPLPAGQRFPGGNEAASNRIQVRASILDTDSFTRRTGTDKFAIYTFREEPDDYSFENLKAKIMSLEHVEKSPPSGLDLAHGIMPDYTTEAR